MSSKRSACDPESGSPKRQARQVKSTKRRRAMSSTPLTLTANGWIGKDLPVIQKKNEDQPQFMNTDPPHTVLASLSCNRNPLDIAGVAQEHDEKPDAKKITAARKSALVTRKPARAGKKAGKKTVSFVDTTSPAKSGPRTEGKKPNSQADVVEDTSPYTKKFFGDLAQTVAMVFPFELFAQAHCCSVGEVSQAISALVVAPLSDPTFCWTDSDMSIVEYGRSVIELYASHYNSKVEELRYAEAFSSADTDSSSSSGGSSKDC